MGNNFYRLQGDSSPPSELDLTQGINTWAYRGFDWPDLSQQPFSLEGAEHPALPYVIADWLYVEKK